MRYLAILSAAALTVCVYVFMAGLSQTPAPDGTKKPHRDCVQLTADPVEMACADGRVYMLPGWVDVGPVTPVPGVPAR